MSDAEPSDFGGIPEQTWDRLYQAALDVRERAYTPYSKFKVGAAFWMDSGETIVGCNVENASFGATICAERTAIGTAISQGAHHPRALVVVTDIDPPAAPCGICRQVLAEFADSLPILLANTHGKRRFTTLDLLLPQRFGEDDLHQSKS